MRKGTWLLRTAPAVLLILLSAAVAPADSVIADAAMNGDRDSIDPGAPEGRV